MNDILKLAREHFADPDGSLQFLTPELTSFYRAAYNKAIEDAAKVCEKELAEWANTSSTNEDYCTAYTLAARYIRALEMK